ncbi:DUF4019 domain-containing protein [Microbulbifer sp.]|uniref:DUF4019 domain-containing protein n=1 Tax=Microbulbifer sp. TaxID=1908541 RepID=UPI003F30DEE8
MKKILFAFAILVASVAVKADESGAVTQVVAWLEGVDAGHYGESWNQTSQLFQQQIPQDKWQEMLDQVRKPLGPKLKREVDSVSRHKTLPGAPDGDYVVVTFATSFENKAQATETVTVEKVASEWRTLGYFIK